MQPRWSSVVLVLTVSCTSPLAPVTPAPEQLDEGVPDIARWAAQELQRAEFARRLATIGPGVDARVVLERLGRPDDVLTEHDPGGLPTLQTAEVWRWGADGHLTFATLGTVQVDAAGLVLEVAGGGGAPPTGFDEDELRRLLRLIAGLRGVEDHDPLRLLQAVNGLWPLGRERSLEVIAEFLRVSSSRVDRPARDGVFLLARALYDPPVGEALPPMIVGAPVPRGPDDPALLPRFPLALVDDVPVAVASGYVLIGQAEAPERHLAWYRDRGVLRPVPLAPTARPVEALERFAMTDGPAMLPRVAGARPPWGWQLHVLEQARRLVTTVTHDDPHPTAEDQLPFYDLGPVWARLRDAADEPLRWNATECQYVRQDGTSLSPLARRVYRRAIWRPSVERGAVTLTLERQDPFTVVGELRITPSGSIPPGKLRIVSVSEGRELFAGDAPSRASFVAGRFTMTLVSFDLELPEGAGVRAILELPGASVTSGTLTP